MMAEELEEQQSWSPQVIRHHGRRYKRRLSSKTALEENKGNHGSYPRIV